MTVPTQTESVLLMLQTSSASLASLTLSEDNSRRRDQIISRARNAMTELCETVSKAETNDELSPKDRASVIRQAQTKAASVIPEMRGLLTYIDADINAMASLPPAPTPADPRISEERAREIRQELNKLDPLEIRARLLSAAASGSDESIRAVLAADPQAFPKLVNSLDDITKRECALSLRYHDDGAGRQAVDDLISAHQSLTATCDDLGRVSGGTGDEIADVAGGGKPRVGGVFAGYPEVK